MILLCCFPKEGSLLKGPRFGCRHIQLALYFLLMTYTYSMRSVLSVAIVAMNAPNITENTNIPVYDWKNQSVVLSAFFWGYFLLQIPTAQIGTKYGPKWVLVTCVAIDSVSCLLIPTVADIFGSTGVMVCRFFQGLAQGGIAPLLHTLLGKWAPPCERSIMATLSYAGSVVGNIVSLSVTGVICSSWWGWPASFYLFGGLGLKWVVLWAFLGADRPASLKRISASERKYIESSLGQETHKVHATPWKAILSSPPFWAVTLSFVGANWGSSVLLTQTPRYLKEILKYDIKSNSLISAAPYLAMLCGALVFSPLCDWLINTQTISRSTARKIFNTIGTVLPGINLTLIGFISQEQSSVSVALLILNGAITAGGFCGFQVNHVDLSPNHSGILMGITNCATSIFSVISPLIVQFIVTDPGDQFQWRIIFLITAAIYASTALVFIFFSSGDVQSWNTTCDEDEENIQPVESTTPRSTGT